MTVTYLQFPEGVKAMYVDDDRKNHVMSHGPIVISGLCVIGEPRHKIVVKSMKVSYPVWVNRYVKRS